jgi:cell cycle sensor histidine kinase DivJ
MLLHEMFGPFNDPRQKEYVGLVRDSGRHLLDVVTSILDVSRIEAGAYWTQLEPFRFADAVEMTRSMMQLQADTKGVRLDTRIAADAGEINADRRAVQQILINLASNAIKFTPGGGEVMIGAQRVGSRLHFWVRDTGIGIAEDDLASLGQPFVQVQNDYTRRFEGTGLGLSLVKGLVTLHEGTMSIESMPGEGTTVSISVPVDGPKGKVEKLVVLPTETSPANRQGGSDGSLRKTAKGFHSPHRHCPEGRYRIGRGFIAQPRPDGRLDGVSCHTVLRFGQRFVVSAVSAFKRVLRDQECREFSASRTDRAGNDHQYRAAGNARG